MKRILGSFIAGVSFVFLYCVNVQADEIRIGGGAGPVEGILKPIKEPLEKATGIKLTINSYGAQIAFRLLDKGGLDAATAGLSFEEFMDEMEKEKIPITNPSSYHHTIIGSGKIYTIVNKNNPINHLTKEQVKNILTGKIKNWKEVGGVDSIIMVVLNKNNPGTNSAVLKIVLDSESFAKGALYVGSVGDLRNILATNTEAIAFGPHALADMTVKFIETPEISRPIILITKGRTSPKIQKLIDFINNEGRKYIKD
jgi:phosphate transport system substrate-binding protein